ncbi:hypothetical protein TRFO_43292 [Tritrichomonas foetus]|uniref:Uncharacterized protein n=1 Tax=Tritrichomonas foetus TaxID=1144522 RepID=A0A1J4KQX4_9EUKA|nr:hypothetical protein TRFO_43292 [Tritrichomonas foetus]|eukprot:OHT13659.1 hypothetical protein TRFO_43292 [Tritrichomonas foetus]
MDNTNKSLTKLINGDWKTVLKGLLVTINEDALTDSDISKILPIISFFQMKTDLELMHIKQAAKRLTKNRSDQIDKVYSIMEQLDSVRPQLQLESLRALINDAAKSLEQNHFGPVLILNSRSWPYIYKPPYPSPENLREITAKISTQYVKIYIVTVILDWFSKYFDWVSEKKWLFRNFSDCFEMLSFCFD